MTGQVPFQREDPVAATQLEEIKKCLTAPEPVLWLFTGDSITHGALHTYGARSYPEHFAERVRWEMGRYRDVVINTGISGDTVPGLLADVEHRVLRFRPQVISIMMGMNDAAAGGEGQKAFRDGYLSLLERIRRDSASPIVLHTPNPVTEYERIRQHLPAYADIVRSIARETGSVLVDHQKLWTQRETPLTSLLDDGTVHPNAFGHVLLAHRLFATLGIFDPQSPTCRLFVP